MLALIYSEYMYLLEHYVKLKVITQRLKVKFIKDFFSGNTKDRYYYMK